MKKKNNNKNAEMDKKKLHASRIQSQIQLACPPCMSPVGKEASDSWALPCASQVLDCEWSKELNFIPFL